MSVPRLTPRRRCAAKLGHHNQSLFSILRWSVHVVDSAGICCECAAHMAPGYLHFPVPRCCTLSMTQALHVRVNAQTLSTFDSLWQIL
jgi:hypothetical protein